jgi:lambda family phage portal protein
MSERLPTRLWRAIATAWRGDALPSGRSYAAAQPHRLLSDWAGTAQSANKATRYQGKALRHRARELRENSGLVARFAQLSRDNIVGPDGVTLQAVVPSTRGSNTAVARQIEAAWYAWADRCTPDGQSWISVCQTLAESWRVEGEALLELIPTSAAPMGLYVRALDVDLLDDKKNTDRTPTGGSIVQGVEYDRLGRVVQYYVLEKHPSDGEVSRYRVLPANRVVHLAHRSRPQQTRGVTPLAPIMTLLQHLDKTDEAIVVLNRVTASKMGALIPGADAQPIDSADGTPPMIEQAPGEWWTLPTGWDVKMLDPGQPTQEYDVFAKHLQRKIAAGLNVSYESLTGDMSSATYSSARMALLVERDAWQGLQTQFVETVCEPVYRLFLQTAPFRYAFELPVNQSPDTVAEASIWHPRRWPWVDPLKDAQGLEVLLSLGLTTRTREANKQGLSFADLVAERAAEEQLLADAGVTLGDAPAAPAEPPTDATASDPTRSLRVA